MIWIQFIDIIKNILFTQTGIAHFTVKEIIMILISFFFLYLAVGKKFEPLLLVPIGYGKA